MAGENAAVAVDLWVWSLAPDDGAVARCAQVLSDDERARAARFIHERHARRFRVGRGRLREILAGYVGASPEALSFAYNAEGKPRIDGPHFNLSHSEDVAALGVCAELSIGVDVERVQPFSEDLPAHVFSAPEREAMARAPHADRTTWFFRGWTRKEAVVKAVGGGLSIPLGDFAVSLEDDASPRLLWWRDDASAARRWSLASFAPGGPFLGAVAAQTGGRPLALRLRSS